MAIFSGSYHAVADQAAVYLTRSGSRLLAYVEQPGAAITGTPTRTLTQAIIFAGRAAGSSFSGTWAHLPKGTARSGGGFSMRQAPFTVGFPGIAVNFAGQPPLRSAEWRQGIAPAASRADAAIQPGHYTALNMSVDLTGTWISEDGTYAYVRQLGDEVFWYAERPHPDGRALASFALHGRRTGNEFAAVSMTLSKRPDVPRAGQDIRLRIDSPWALRIATRSGSQSQWWRVEGLWLDVGIGQVELREDADTRWAKESPMFWSVALKADGATQTAPGHSPARASIAMAHKPRLVTELPDVSIETVESSQAFQVGLFPFGVIFKDLYFARSANLPASIGRHKTVLLTVPGLNPRSDAARRRAQFAVLFVALEHDSSAWNTVEAARRDWLSRISDTIATWARDHAGSAAGLIQTRLLRQLSRLSPGIVEKIRDYDHAFTNSDDLVGTQFVQLSWSAFDPYPGEDASGPVYQPDRRAAFQLRFASDAGLYVADGSVIASGGAERLDLRKNRVFLPGPKISIPTTSVLGKGQLSRPSLAGLFRR